MQSGHTVKRALQACALVFFLNLYSCLPDAVDDVLSFGPLRKAFMIAWERATNAFLFDTASVAFDGSGRFEGSAPALFRDCDELGAENEPEEGAGEPFCILVGANWIEDVCSSRFERAGFARSLVWIY